MTFKIDMRYTNGKIYKLVSNVTGDVYYGSTTKKLSYRLSKHKTNYKRYIQGKYSYITSFKILETGDYDIHLVENYSCLCKKQLEAIERIYIENYKCINKCIPTRTKKEYCKKWRNKYGKEYQKKYYVNNKYKLNKKYDCECGGSYLRRGKTRHLKTKKHQNYLNTC